MTNKRLNYFFTFLFVLFFTNCVDAEVNQIQPLNLTLNRQQLQSVIEASSAQKSIQKKTILFIKVSHNSILTDAWAKNICSQIDNIFTSIYGQNTQSHCFKSDSENQQYLKTFNDKMKEIKPDFLFDVQRGLDGYLKLKLTNLNQADTSYANSVGWNIQDTPDFDQILKERLRNSYFAINHLNVLRDSLAEIVLETFHVNQNKIKINEKDVYNLLRNSRYWTAETRKFILAGTELLVALDVGWYGYHNLSNNRSDWDYTDFKESIKNKIRLGSEFRYDDNTFKTNEAHVSAGVNYYLLCRGNGLTALQSYMCSMAGSLAWEVLIEWREVFAINDQIFTSTGGAVLGESIFQLGNYIEQKAPPWFKNSIGWLWKAPKKFQQAINSGILSGQDSNLDSNDPLVTGKFEFELGVVKTNNGRAEQRVGLKNEVNLIPFSAEPGREIRFINDLVETELDIDAPMGDILNQYDIFTKVVFSAYYTKNINIDSKNNLNGYTFFVGPSAALSVKNDSSLRNDFMGVVHVLGTTAQLVNYYKGFKITSTLDFWGDSVMVKSFMIEKYKDKYGPSDLVGNLARANYYHGFGYTTRGQVLVEYGPWSTGLNISSTNSTNTNFRQRDFGMQLKELDMNDQTNSIEIFVERAISSNIKIRLAIEKVKRSGEIIRFGSASMSETRKKFSLLYYF